MIVLFDYSGGRPSQRRAVARAVDQGGKGGEQTFFWPLTHPPEQVNPPRRLACSHCTHLQRARRVVGVRGTTHPGLG